MSKSNGFKKIEGIKNLKKYNLSTPKTIFIFDFEKQEKEIDNFIKDRDYVMIRSDKDNDIDFCPHDLRCPKSKAKEFIKELISKNYAAILQECIPWTENQVSGNILTFKKDMLIELMEGGPLILLNRDGRLDEYVKLRRDNSKEIEHLGKRLIKKKELENILNLIKKVPPYKIIEFAIGPTWFYFWQIRDDKTTKRLE